MGTQRETKRLFALFVGINDYASSPLDGCINDVILISNYFRRLCQAPPNTIQPEFKFLLAPTIEDQPLLEENQLEAEVHFELPTRKNFIHSFVEHFGKADAKRGDICLLYYSGHGSFMKAPDIYSEVEPTGILQTLCLLDSRQDGVHDLLDKELGYLIAKVLEDKGPKPGMNIPGVHFLSLMDCCHSGSNTREEGGLKTRRMKNGPLLEEVDNILGLVEDGNCFYEKLIQIDGKLKVPRGGIKHGRHISLAAARDAEKAIERPLYLRENGQFTEILRNQGIFTYSLVRILEEVGTNISYGELIRRLQMAIRVITTNQIPVLGKTIQTEEDLLFLNNELRTPPREYEISFREGTWYLNAGAIHGIVGGEENKDPGQTGERQLGLLSSTVKVRQLGEVLEEDSASRSVERIVKIEKVLPTESILDASSFSALDEEKVYSATLHNMPLPAIRFALDKGMSPDMKQSLLNSMEANPPQYITLIDHPAGAELVVKNWQSKTGKNGYILTKSWNDTPLFMTRESPKDFLHDADAVGRWMSVLNMDNALAGRIRDKREDLEIEIRTLEGRYYDSSNFNRIADDDFKLLELNPKSVRVSYQKINVEGEWGYMPPAIRVKVNNVSPIGESYWVGALCLSNAFGINHRFAEVQKLSEDESNLSLELKFQEDRGFSVKEYLGLPLNFDENYLNLGITDITDYILFFVSNKRFDLSQYYQEDLPIFKDKLRSFSFGRRRSKKDFWFTIKVPIHIHHPLDDFELRPGKTRTLGSISARIGNAQGVSTLVHPTTKMAARKLRNHLLEKKGTSSHSNGIMPDGFHFMDWESVDSVFTLGLANTEPE